MKRLRLVLALILALLAGFSIRSLSAGSTAGPVAQALAGQGDSDGRKWEYCAVTRAQYTGSIRGNQYWIVYFRGKGVEVSNVEAGPSGNAQGRAIARLGEEGWELVGEGMLDTDRPGGRDAPPALFFKRRRE